MATTTPNLGLTKPTVGADADAWGGQLNASLDVLDAKVLDKTTGGTVSGAVNVIAATTAPAVRITQTGTGEALRVEDEANPDATPFVIDAAGNVGIGTGVPSSKIHAASAGSILLRVENTLNSGAAAVFLKNTLGGTVLGQDNLGGYLLTDSATPLLFYTNNTERLRLDPAGNLGLGVTPSAWVGSVYDAFDLNQTASIAGYFNGINTSSAAFLTQNAFEQVDGGGFKYKISGTGANSLALVNGQFRFFTAPSGTAGAPITFTQAMTLDASGRLMVGTTTPDTINGGLTLSASANNTDTTQPFLNEIFAIKNTDRTTNNLTVMYFDGLSSTGSVRGLGAIGMQTTSWTDGAINSNMLFWTSNSGMFAERARITSAGYFKASNTGTYGNAAGLPDLSADNAHLFQNNQAGKSCIVTVGAVATSNGVDSFLPTGSTGFHYRGFVNATTTYQINANGSGGQVSDANLKTDIVEATPKLADLNRVRIVNYRWKEESGISNRKEIGVIAQELEQVFPGLVDTIEREDGTEQKMVRYSVFVPMLIKAVQELSAQNAALESRLAALEAK